MTDIQILNGMQSLLLALRDAKIPLYHAVAELKAQMNMLTSIDQNLLESLDSKWLGLEEVNALALDRKDFQIPKEDLAFVEKTISGLLTLIGETKSELEKNSNNFS